MTQDKILLAKAGDGAEELLLDGLGIDEHYGKINAMGALAFTKVRFGSVVNGEPTLVYGQDVERSARRNPLSENTGRVYRDYEF